MFVGSYQGFLYFFYRYLSICDGKIPHWKQWKSGNDSFNTVESSSPESIDLWVSKIVKQKPSTHANTPSPIGSNGYVLYINRMLNVALDIQIIQ